MLNSKLLCLTKESLKFCLSNFGKHFQRSCLSNYLIREFAPNQNGTFFGYYDKTPFSSDGRYLLGMNLQSPISNTANIGYFDQKDGGSFFSIGESTAWSWQLGSRLQWLPGNEDDIVCYNRLVGSQLGFVVQHIKSKKILEQYSHPIFDVDSAGRYAIGLNFSRLHRMREGYGYYNFPDSTFDQKCPDADGVIRIDLSNRRCDLILSLRFLSNFFPRNTMLGAEHYINHLSFSPSGKRFFFLHLWNLNGKSYSRGITCDIEGRQPYVIDEGINISHYAWMSETALLIHTSRHPYGVSFNIYQDGSPGKRRIGEQVLNESGHPSFSPDRQRLIVDTYPGLTRMQHLLLCDSEGYLIDEIGRFHSPSTFSGAQKCDLHPRWDRSGKHICIDASYRGYRAMYVIDF